MKKKAVIAGIGKMGVAIAYAMDKLGYSLLCIEPSGTAMERLETFGIEPEMSSKVLYPGMLDGASVFISAATFQENVALSAAAAEAGVPYCDLGGDPDVRDKVIENGKKYGSLVLTDLGLAPGWVNIIADKWVSNTVNEGEQVIEVEMRVGGLPQSPDGSLRYARTWSTDGLINEYSGKCPRIRDGKLEEAEALHDLEPMKLRGLDNLLGAPADETDYEAFNTKGAFSHSAQTFLDAGVLNADYKTIRHKGHCDLLRFLRYECKLNDKELARAVENACPMTTEDVVHVSVLVQSERWQEGEEHRIVSDDMFTAMQKATAFPAAAAASVLAEGQLNEGNLNYEGIGCDTDFDDKIQTLGLTAG